MSLLPRITQPLLADEDLIEPQPRKTLRVYGMSDIHFNNHHHPLKNHSHPFQYRPKVVQFLDEILEEQARETAEVVLILNGDIFDITGSWPDDTSPLTMTAPQQLSTVQGVLDEIVASNPEVIKRLRQFLEFDDTRIVYVIGNHDRWLEHPALEIHMRRILDLGAESPRFVMTRRYYLPEIGLLALHGDEFDPSCKPPKAGLMDLNKAERLDMIFINGLLGKVSQRLEAAGYNEAVVKSIQETVRALEYVRPIHLAIDHLYSNMARLQEQGGKELKNLEETVEGVILESLSAAFQKHNATWLDRLALKALIKFLSFRIGQRCLHFYISRARVILKDAYQLDSVRTLIQTTTFETPVRIVYLGHTHRLLFQEMIYYQGLNIEGKNPLEEKSCLVINAGGHKKTIFYPNPDEIYPAGMMAVEYNRGDKTLVANLETNTRRLFNPPQEA